MDSKKTIELLYIAHDYQRVGDIDYVGEEKTSINKTPIGVNLKSMFNSKCRKFHNHILVTALEKLNNIIQSDEKDKGDIYICRNEVRKNELISLFMDPNVKKPTEDTLINGIVGSLSIVLKHKDIEVEGMGLYDTDDNVDIKITVRFVSRFDSLKNEQQQKSFFAAQMLTYGVIDSLYGDVDCDDNNLFDFLLIDVFYRNLKEAYRKGPFSTYRRFQGNDDMLRGSIDIARHIKLNAGMCNGRVAYRYRENTINNYLNILIVKAYEHVKKKYPDIVARKIDCDHDLRGFLNRLMYDTDALSISTHKAFMENRKPISHPFYTEYEKVRTVCLHMLRDEGRSIFELSNTKASGFLYYLPDLWENYLENVFNKILSDEAYNQCVLSCQEEKGYIKKKNDEKYIFTSRPDFVFAIENENKLILDAKMRPGWSCVLDDGYVDFSSDINKCIRDKVVHQADHTGVVIPINFKRKAVDEFFNVKKAILKDIDVVKELCIRQDEDASDILESAKKEFDLLVKVGVDYWMKNQSAVGEDEDDQKEKELMKFFVIDKPKDKSKDNFSSEKIKIFFSVFKNEKDKKKIIVKFFAGCVWVWNKYFKTAFTHDNVKDIVIENIPDEWMEESDTEEKNWIYNLEIEDWMEEVNTKIKNSDTEDKQDLSAYYSKIQGSYNTWKENIANDEEYMQLKEEYSNDSIGYARRLSETSEDRFYIVPFVVPNSHFYQSYAEWKRAFLASETEFRNAVRENVFDYALTIQTV